MHLYIIPRGIRHEIEMFEKYVQTQMLPWIRKNMKTNEYFPTMFQLGYRDAGPFKELIFPEECLFEVLDMLGYFKTATRKKDYAIGDIKMKVMRKIIGRGVKPIPKKVEHPNMYPRICLVQPLINKDGKETLQAIPYRYCHADRIAIHFIGIKHDKFGVMGPLPDGNSYYQEFL